MPRRRRYPTLTNRDIQAIRNAPPSAWMIMGALLLGGFLFVVGFCLVIVIADWVREAFKLSSSVVANISIISILALIVFTVLIVIATSIGLIVYYNKELEKKYHGMRIANIDRMTGVEFEQYLKRVLTSMGYEVSMTKVTGDLGVDLVATGNDNKYAIQAKRYSAKVSRHAISDSVAGMYHYGCNKAMVITNSYFSPGAIELAQSTGCILIDRDILAKWINDYQSKVLSDVQGEETQ